MSAPAALTALVALMLALAPPSLAQERTKVLTEYEELASFEEARSLAIDALDRVYVVDQGTQEVVQMDLEGQELARLGGPGGPFEELCDIDPGVGLTWLVADGDGGKVHRFSQSLLLTESVTVPRAQEFDAEAFSTQRSIEETGEHGRPVAVAQSPNGDIFAIEADGGAVLKWDTSRRLERTIGALGPGALSWPAALAAGAKWLFVLDKGADAVMVYDHFGGYVRTIAQQGGLAQSLTMEGDRLWVVYTSHLVAYNLQGRPLVRINVRPNLNLVDARAIGDTILLLTATQLFRTRINP